MDKKNHTNTIIALIKESKFAISHSQLQEILKDQCNRVTIYRILEKLVTKGTIHKVMDIDGIAKFAFCNNCEEENHEHDHIHFSCIKCNQVSCLDDMEPNVKLPSGYLIEQVSYTISGTCPECN